ncbi:MAG: putative repeat protein (TIGR04052 family) [Myxococcota bacterium]|jgi:uncharacterized repeat protein (TIGR04052 family)
MKNLSLLVAGLAGLSFVVGGCDSDPDPAGDRSVAIQFGAVVGAEVAACGQSYSGIGTSSSTISPKDLRFYVHGVHLIDASGKQIPVALTVDGKWQDDSVALLDFEDKTGNCDNGTSDVNDQVVGTVPDGDYVGMGFTLGVPAEKNHQDAATAASPLNITGLFWNWTGGYKHARLDIVSTGQATGWNVHLGATACAEDTAVQTVVCENGNRTVVRMDAFDVDSDVVNIDLAAMLENSDVDVNGAPASGCMSGADDPECAAIFGAFGLSIKGSEAPMQSVFAKATR